MKNNARMLRRYFRAIRQALPCDRQLKRLILCDIKESVYSYLEENPQAEFSAIEARFGKPETIAASYVCNEEPSTLLSSYHIRRRIVTIIAAAIITILSIWGISMAILVHHHTTHFPGFIEVSTTQEAQYETNEWYHY